MRSRETAGDRGFRSPGPLGNAGPGVGAATTDAQIRQVRFDRFLSCGGGVQRGTGSARIEARPSCQNALSDLLHPHRPARQKSVQVVGVGGEYGGFGLSGGLSLGDSREDGVDGVFVPV